ncbi:hypothetical protein P7228_01545 [Altererythrobacter arenosus]|uniref:Uncharacterized protein n=1 Tax=Altererythrobacter arenosus TaxID=3032592 RepID=A0ABY8FUK6_9SPHN|nr:hypothetical protein [Altererythrobacter sp. CAU 1644]WFL77780.1 hypothetical protein P7228_01545 [Altererythrobacter sp. CAU 1644]
MNSKLIAAGAASALFASFLAGCGSNETPAPDSERVQAPATDGSATGASGKAGAPHAVETNPVGDPDAPDIAGTNCIEELASTANQPKARISIQRVEVDETGPTHFLMIEGAEAPWSCKTLPNGSVTELMYTQEG